MCPLSETELFFFQASIECALTAYWDSLVADKVKNLPAIRKTRVWSLGREGPLEKGMAIHSSILAWRIPWTEEPGRLSSMGLQRVRQYWATHTHIAPYSPKHYTHCHFCGHREMDMKSLPTSHTGVTSSLSLLLSLFFRHLCDQALRPEHLSCKGLEQGGHADVEKVRKTWALEWAKSNPKVKERGVRERAECKSEHKRPATKETVLSEKPTGWPLASDLPVLLPHAQNRSSSVCIQPWHCSLDSVSDCLFLTQDKLNLHGLQCSRDQSLPARSTLVLSITAILNFCQLLSLCPGGSLGEESPPTPSCSSHLLAYRY